MSAETTIQEILTPHCSCGMCSFTFRMPLDYHHDLEEIIKQWERLVGPSNVSQISRLIFSRGLLSFKNTQGYIDLEKHLFL